MPIDLQIIRSSEFVRLNAQGHFDFEGSKQALALLAGACRKRGLERALLDLRDLPIPPAPLFTSAQLATLVGTFKEAGFTRRQRLAVLYRTDPHYGARRFAFIGTFKGWQVRAFAEFEPALMWLSSGTEEPQPGADEEIPIQARTPAADVKIKGSRTARQKDTP